MHKGGVKAIYISWFFFLWSSVLCVSSFRLLFTQWKTVPLFLFIYSLLMHDSFFLWCHRCSLKPLHVFLHLSQPFLFLGSPGCTPICISLSFLLQTNIYITLTVCPSSLRGVCCLSLFGSCSCLPLQNLIFFSASFYIAPSQLQLLFEALAFWEGEGGDLRFWLSPSFVFLFLFLLATFG